MLILNTSSKEVFPGVEADGFEGNNVFFDRPDKYRRTLWRVPEFDLTYALENTTDNEEKKRKGYRGSMLGVDRTWFYIEQSTYIRNPRNKQVMGMLITMASVNDLLGRSGVAINTHVQQGGPGEPFAEPTLIDIYRRNTDGTIREPKVLLGRLPVLDTQFTIPRPVTAATITFHGLFAFNSIAFYGRRAEGFDSAKYGYELVKSSSLIFPYQFHQSQYDALIMKKPPETTYSVWKDMQKARGAFGSGAGTVFWNKYLRTIYGNQKRLR